MKRSLQGTSAAAHATELGPIEHLVEDLVEDMLEDGSLSDFHFADQQSQCWGAELAALPTTCEPGYVRGHNHLKNKFCDCCRQRGFFVDAECVRVLDATTQEMFSNKNAAGLWTASSRWPELRFRVINQTHKCTGSRLVVFEGPPPAEIAAIPPAEVCIRSRATCCVRISSANYSAPAFAACRRRAMGALARE